MTTDTDAPELPPSPMQALWERAPQSRGSQCHHTHCHRFGMLHAAVPLYTARHPRPVQLQLERHHDTAAHTAGRSTGTAAPSRTPSCWKL